MLPATDCLGLPNDQSWDRGARRSTQRAGHALQQTRDVAGRADQKSGSEPQDGAYPWPKWTPVAVVNTELARWR